MSEPPAQQAVLGQRYRLLEVVGEGGMAVVWRGEDLLLGRPVAVKVLRGQYAADPDFLERLRCEARAAAALNDPGVVGVYDVGEDAGKHYLVMEFVPGRDLKDVIRTEAPLAPGRAVSLCAEMARAVGKAHQAGMVHRDLKPQNVLVTPDGRLKVADFGIARAITAAGTTAPGVVMGTVHYLAPEVAEGGPASPASDVYSLGVVLYEMLTRRLPFEADSTVGVVMKIIHDVPQPVNVANPQVPAVLAGIVERAMARDPGARYPDATAMAEALESFARWSEQVTGGLALPERPGAGGAAGAGGARGRPPARTGARAPAVARPRGATLDPVGLMLAIVALLAVAGLVPLWSAVRSRYHTAQPLGFLRRAGVVAVGTAAPTPVATATVVQVSVPDVVGQEAAAASRVIARAGLGVSTDVETSSAVPEGRVIRQRPPAESIVPGETVVELVVSGQAPLVVPDLSGTWSDVSSALESMGFVPVRRSAWGGDQGSVDQVMALDPPPGSRWPRGAPVHVTVNAGSWLALGVDFADNIHLRGIDIYRNRYAPGEAITFSAVWEAVAVEADGTATPAARGDYIVRAALTGPDGTVVGGDEHVPVGGSRPTSSWQSGEVVSGDSFSVPVPADAPPGNYTLWLDLYRNGDPTAELVVRASAYAATDGNRVELMAITIAPPAT